MRKGNLFFIIIVATGLLLGILLMVFMPDLFTAIVGEGM
jgi:hypothetical protein